MIPANAFVRCIDPSGKHAELCIHCQGCGLTIIDHNSEFADDGLDEQALAKALYALNEGREAEVAVETRPIEMGYAVNGGTWSTIEIKIPADTSEQDISQVAEKKLLQILGDPNYHNVAGCWIHNTMDDEIENSS